MPAKSRSINGVRRLAVATAVTFGLFPVAAFAVASDVTTTPAAPPAIAPAPIAPAPVSPAPIAIGNAELVARLGTAGPLTVAGERAHAALLRRFYAANGYQTVWDSHAEQAKALLNLVMHAEDQGLDPMLFHADILSRNTAISPIEHDLLLSDAFLGYADALYRGAMPIEDRDDDEDLQPAPLDIAHALTSAIAGSDAAAAIAALAPQTPEYKAMRHAYAAYRAIAKNGGWARVDDSRPEALRQRLAAEGYLAADDGRGGFDGDSSRAIRAFQAHHALGETGRLNPSTIAELNVPAEMRAEQVAINLERLRWLPRQIPADRIWVNTAEARLQLFKDDRKVFSTRVVVGQDDKQTPEFTSTVSSVLFNPPWNIPVSIAEKEIRPRLGADPDYLQHHHMIVRKNGMIQQEAGPHSALGRLKFEMTDRYDVYLHDTPEKSFFAHNNRQDSHGCVRVEDPRQLASLLLGESVETINQNVAAGHTRRRMLPQPVAAFLVYQTVFPDADGALEFRHDFYERDAEIWPRLSRLPQPPVAQDSNFVQPRG